MTAPRSPLWRLCFLLAGLLIIGGGSRHPRDDTMAGMLGNPDWVLSHTLLTAGFVALLAGLALYRRAHPLPNRTRRWSQWTVYATTLQAVEITLHTAAVVDHANLVAGRATPVLTTHLTLALAAYPIFGLTMTGFIVAASRDRALASPWVAWLGIAGALAHAFAPILTTFVDGRFAILFPMVMLLALWLVLAAFWPLRASAGMPAPARTV